MTIMALPTYEVETSGFNVSAAHININNNIDSVISLEIQRQPLVVDVMSIGSNTRPDYTQTQAETWASHPIIRNFWSVTEDDDNSSSEWGFNCSAIANIQDYVSNCRNRHATGFLQQYRFFPARWVLRKANPVGWLCAQVRVGTALATLARRYLAAEDGNAAPHGNLPDFVLLVDDDTMFQMDLLLEDHLQHFRADNSPTILAGCLNVLPREQEEVDRFSPFGGAGTVWSRGALERLLQPIHCQEGGSISGNKVPSSTRSFAKNVCERMKENLILERDLFEDGMYMFEFIERVYHRYPNCFHSDWLLGHFIHYYILSEPMEPVNNNNHWWDVKGQGRLLPLHNPDSVGVFYNESLPDGRLCSNTNQNPQTNETCLKDSLVCHYITPERMRQVTNEWMTS